MEGCLTYPHLFLNLRRPNLVEFEYMDMEGNPQKGKFGGMTARIFQHEYDHMEGTNFTRRVSKLKLNMAQKRATKVRKRASRIA